MSATGSHVTPCAGHDLRVEQRSVLAQLLHALNQPFLTLMREHRPFVILKAATSVDGWPSGVTGHEENLSGILTGMLMTKLRPDGAPRLAGRDRLQRRLDRRSPHAGALQQ